MKTKKPKLDCSSAGPLANKQQADRVGLRPRVSSWVKWFDAQPANDKRTIALAAIERLINEGMVSFWGDDLIDKWGDEIPENTSIANMPEEHLYWNDEHKEDLRIPF